MGIAKVPSSQVPHDERVAEEVDYNLFWCPRFPICFIGGMLDKDPDEHEWLQGLYDDILESGELRNPIIIWNHHPERGRKQPLWLLRAGSNRMWCIEQLGWKYVPAVVSTRAPTVPPANDASRIKPRQIESYFPDGGNIWCNEHGFGLLRAKSPEITYAEISNRTLRKTDNHKRRKIINPLLG